jgi:hypothetical protein
MVRPNDLVNILDQKTNTEALSKQQLREMQQVKLLKTKRPDITWTGLDSGERYALAYSSLLSDSKVAFGTYSKDAHYNSIHKPTTDYINSQKPEDIKNQERQLSENPSDSNLSNKNALYSRAYYGSEELLKRKQLGKIKRTTSFNIFLDQLLKSAGSNSHTKANEWLGKGKSFVFVFEIGADFNSTGKKRRPAMHVELQNFVVKKVL